MIVNAQNIKHLIRPLPLKQRQHGCDGAIAGFRYDSFLDLFQKLIIAHHLFHMYPLYSKFFRTIYVFSAYLTRFSNKV